MPGSAASRLFALHVCQKKPLSLSVISKDAAEDITGQALFIPVYEKEAEFYVLEEQDTGPYRCFLADPVYLADYRKIVTETVASIGFFPGMAIGRWTDLIGGIVVLPGFKSEFWEFTLDEESPPLVFALTRLEPDKAVAHQAELRNMFQKKRLSKEDLSEFGMLRYREGLVRFSLAGHEMLDQFLIQNENANHSNQKRCQL